MSAAAGASPRVLVVAYDFPPHAAIGTMRTLRVVRELHARGWDVSVLTGKPSTFLPSTPVDQALLDRLPPGLRILRAGALRPWSRLQEGLRAPFRSGPAAASVSPGGSPASGASSKSSSGRAGYLGSLVRMKDVIDAALSIPDGESGWLLTAFAKGTLDRLRAKPPDVIYSSAPPWTGQLVAAALKQTLRRPWVADFRDPWSRAPWRGDRYRFALRAAASLERFVVRRADRVVFVTAANREDFTRHYGPAIAEKFHVVPNGCDPSEFDALRGLPVPEDGPFVMLHAGSLYAGRTPMPLMRALSAAIRRGAIAPGRFRLRFLGANALKGTDLAAACRELGLQDVVEFLPRVPREQSLRAMMTASSLLLLQPGHTVSVPAKVYEYLAAGRPIFAIAEDGETADLVRGSGAGVSVQPDDEALIADALVAAVNAGRAAAVQPRRELFDGNQGAAAIADIVGGVIGAGVRAVPARGAKVDL